MLTECLRWKSFLMLWVSGCGKVVCLIFSYPSMLTIAVRWPRNPVITTINNIHEFCVCIIYNNDMSHRFVSSFVSLINGQTGLVVLKCSRQLQIIEFTAPLELQPEFVWQMTVVWFWFLTTLHQEQENKAMFEKEKKKNIPTNKKMWCFKGVMNWEIKIPLIFWYIRGHCAIKKHYVCFRIQNVHVSLKTAYIEANLPKQQVVECTTLWHNSVAKHCLCRRRSTPASTSLPV